MTAQDEARTFLAALHDPRAAQSECLLQRIVQSNVDCDFGREHGFGRVRSVRDFQAAVPIRTYDELADRVRRMMRGTPRVLVASPVRHFFVTSGTTAEPKYIPVTHALIRDKSRAFGIYWSLLFERHPRARGGEITSNVADAGAWGRTPGGVPYSSESAFWNRLTRATQGRGHFVLPESLSQIEDPGLRDSVLARLLLERDLSVLMSLNPSTILVLLERIRACADSLARALEAGALPRPGAIPSQLRRSLEAQLTRQPERARRLRGAGDRLQITDLWPELEVMVSWRSPMLRPYVERLRGYAGSTPHEDYVTMASEGILAIPVSAETGGAALATTVHFYEFIPEAQAESAQPDVLLAHELEVGHSYVVVLTTSAGLYRYNIGDVVRVTGFTGGTPCIEFLHRAGATCSLSGEKLTEEQVSGAVSAVTRSLRIELASFTAHPSREGFPHYVFLAECPNGLSGSQARAFLAALDSELGSCNLEYRAKRSSERLGAPELWLLRAGESRSLEQRRLTSGGSRAQQKATFLTRDPGFSDPLHIAERFCAD